MTNQLNGVPLFLLGLVWMCVFLPVPVHAQPTLDSVATDTTFGADALHLKALAQEHGIVLRWGLASARAWRHANDVGYRIERLPVRDGRPAAKFSLLTSEPIRPWPKGTWREEVQGENRMAALAFHLLYGARAQPDLNAGLFPRMRARATEQESRHGFALFSADLDSLAARGLGLRHVDRPTADADEYLYRVYVDGQPKTYAIDTAYALVDPEPQKRRRVLGVEASSEAGRMRLQWHPIGADGAAFSAFHVERAPNEDGPFDRLNEAPILSIADRPGTPVQFVDTTVTPGTRYTYRITGITPFATESRGTTVSVLAQDHVAPPTPVIDSVSHEGGAQVAVQWSLSSPPPDLAGFYLGRGNSPDGPFEIHRDRLVSPNTRSYVDSLHVAGQPTYVVVLAADTAGNVASSIGRRVVVIDETPPKAPTGLSAAADTTGQVVVKWNLGDDSDLAGYRVYWANQDDHAFTLLSPDLLADTVFIDTLDVRSLTRKAHYEVAALDENYNPSNRARVQVTLPDRVPPSAPVLRQVRAAETGVSLAWVPSSSADVEQHVVVRRTGDDAPWDTLATGSATDNAFVDSTASAGTTYAYTVIAVDSAGHQRAAERAVHAKPFDSGIRPSVDDLEATVDEGRIRLQWAHTTAPKQEVWYVVYRAMGSSSLRRVATTETPTYVDGRVRAAGPYRYAVQVQHRDGGVSRRSESVQVTVPQ